MGRQEIFREMLKAYQETDNFYYVFYVFDEKLENLFQKKIDEDDYIFLSALNSELYDYYTFD